MRSISFLALVTLASLPGYTQINPDDSTVQVVGFWALNETQSYAIALEKVKVQGTDTTSREKIKYDIDITIKDSTSDSYIIEWFYHNYDVTTENEITQKMMAVAENVRVMIKTDEFGAIEEVVNWQEVRDHIKKSTTALRKEFKDTPKIGDVITQIENTFSTKAAIESVAILDAQQFYIFHGAKYKLGEVLEGTLKSANLYGTEPFDTDVTAYLDEINIEDNNFVLRSTQSINADQLAEATYNYLVSVSKSMGASPPKRETFTGITNETLTASRIHDSGWVVYSILTKTVKAQTVSNIEERIIEIR